MISGNLLGQVPESLQDERFEAILQGEGVRIERILSPPRHSSPARGWYDQDEHEWVLVLSGSGTLQFDDGHERTLGPGEYLHIPAGCRHRVATTAADTVTIWLAVFHR